MSKETVYKNFYEIVEESIEWELMKMLVNITTILMA